MDTVVKICLSFVTLFLLIFFAFDTSVIRTVNTDNEDALERATRTAISQGVNRGTLRVKERFTVDPDVVEESLVKNYAKSIGFNEQSTKRKVNVHTVNIDPPLVATEAVTGSNSLTKNYFTNWNEFKDSQDVLTKEKRVLIYEAKSPSVPPEGGVTD